MDYSLGGALKENDKYCWRIFPFRGIWRVIPIGVYLYAIMFSMATVGLCIDGQHIAALGFLCGSAVAFLIAIFFTRRAMLKIEVSKKTIQIFVGKKRKARETISQYNYLQIMRGGYLDRFVPRYSNYVYICFSDDVIREDIRCSLLHLFLRKEEHFLAFPFRKKDVQGLLNFIDPLSITVERRD